MAYAGASSWLGKKLSYRARACAKRHLQHSIFRAEIRASPVLYLTRTQLATTETSDIKVFQTAGRGLDQGDADVFYELLRRVFNSGQETRREARVCFNRSELVKALGRAPGGKTRKLLDESLDRLFRAEFEFSVPGVFVGKSRLILKMYCCEPGSIAELDYDYDVLLDVELSRLFDNGRWSILRRSERQRLSRNPLAKGLHSFFSTHASPHPMKPDTLRLLMGRHTMQSSKFLAVLEPALGAVKLATGWPKCELQREGKHAGKVVVDKGIFVGSPTIARHSKSSTFGVDDI
jgi:hypothetical protein